MAVLTGVTLGVPDTAAAESFHVGAFDLGTDLVSVEASTAPTTGFRGFRMSLVVSQPSTVDSLIGSALELGATSLKPVEKSFWGYGGVVQAPDGTIWTVASSSKKDKGPATREIDDIVLLLGVADVKASKRFYVERGLTVAKSYGSKYVEFDSPAKQVKLALQGRRVLAKDTGVDPDGSGTHRVVLLSDAGPFTDPDGFEWRGNG